MKKKKPSKYKLEKKKTWASFSKMIRLRDCLSSMHSLTHGICCTCGKKFPIKKLQAGHFIAGRNNSMLFDERCVHAQCIGCNTFGGGQIKRYELFMYAQYGKNVVEELYRRANMTVKYTIADLINMRAGFERRIEKMKKGVSK